MQEVQISAVVMWGLTSWCISRKCDQWGTMASTNFRFITSVMGEGSSCTKQHILCQCTKIRDVIREETELIPRLLRPDEVMNNPAEDYGSTFLNPHVFAALIQPNMCRSCSNPVCCQEWVVSSFQPVRHKSRKGLIVHANHRTGYYWGVYRVMATCGRQRQQQQHGPVLIFSLCFPARLRKASSPPTSSSIMTRNLNTTTAK